MGQYPCAQEECRPCDGEKQDTLKFTAPPLQEDQVVLGESPIPIKRSKLESKDSDGNRTKEVVQENQLLIPSTDGFIEETVQEKIQDNARAEEVELEVQQEVKGPDPEELRRAQQELDEQRRAAEEADREMMAKYEREKQKKEVAPPIQQPPPKQEEPKCKVQWKSSKGEMKVLIFRRRPLGINFERPMMGSFKVRIAGFSKGSSHAQELGAERGWLLVSANGKEVSGLSFEKALNVLSEACAILPASS